MAALAFERSGRNNLALLAALTGALGHALALAAFRRPERPLRETVPLVVKSWGAWAVVGMTIGTLLRAPARPNRRA